MLIVGKRTYKAAGEGIKMAVVDKIKILVVDKWTAGQAVGRET